MAYATVLTFLTHGPNPLRMLDAASAVARAHDAHLEVIALGIDRSAQGFSYTEVNAALLEAAIKEARSEAAALRTAAQDKLKNSGLRQTVTEDVCSHGFLPSTVRRYARFSDLVVLPQPYGPHASLGAAAVTEAALFEADVPVLVLPDDTTEWAQPNRAAIGWNESDEALSAVRHARPLLTGTATTFVTVIDPPQHGRDRSDPGGLLAQSLARHGVRCEIDVLSRSMPRISDVLIRNCTDRNIDLMVMGAYGRSRWSEAMFGGATRDMLERCPIPLLMAR